MPFYCLFSATVAEQNTSAFWVYFHQTCQAIFKCVSSELASAVFPPLLYFHYQIMSDFTVDAWLEVFKWPNPATGLNSPCISLPHKHLLTRKKCDDGMFCRFCLTSEQGSHPPLRIYLNKWCMYVCVDIHHMHLAIRSNLSNKKNCHCCLHRSLTKFGTVHLMCGKWMWRSVTVIHDLPFSECFFKAAYSTLNESQPIWPRRIMSDIAQIAFESIVISLRLKFKSVVEDGSMHT